MRCNSAATRKTAVFDVLYVFVLLLFGKKWNCYIMQLDLIRERLKNIMCVTIEHERHEWLKGQDVEN